ncbi:ICOS ligand-like isoform X2 [Stegastes partitus]|uniref:ICOS ligand-like isoform X2 n=1 Tax=Stegastes partitus TaxID=144197 RepID=A0A9Y4NTT6_9TELE|nr:PREDICTED: ICOS ligand-like isoform X2 [Stegastes partitus]
MAARTSAPYVAFLLSVLTSCSSSAEQNVSVNTQDNAILPCMGPRDASITLLQWKMLDKDSEGFVFFFRENRSYESYQIPSLKNRVQLSDPQMKNGNVSVTVKNVTFSDAGKYECSFYTSSRQRSRRAADFSYIINLHVEERHSGRQHLALVAPLVALVALLVAVLWKFKGRTEQPAAEEAGEQQLV